LKGFWVNVKGNHRVVLSVTLLQRSVAMEVETSWLSVVQAETRESVTQADTSPDPRTSGNLSSIGWESGKKNESNGSGSTARERKAKLEFALICPCRTWVITPPRMLLNEDAFVSMLYLERRRAERAQNGLC